MRLPRAAAAAIGLLLVCPVAAGAAPTASEISTPNTRGGQLAEDSAGKMWVLQPDAGGLVSVTSGGVVSNLLSLVALSSPVGLTAGDDGAVYSLAAGFLGGGSVERTGANGVKTSVANVVGAPTAIAAGPDGTLWVTVGQQYTNQAAVIKLTRSTSGEWSSTPYVLPSGSQPHSIVAGTDGGMWFLDSSAAIARRIAVTDGALSAKALPYSAITDLAFADGQLWFVKAPNVVGRVPLTGTPAAAAITGVTGLSAIAPGPDGAVWFTGSDVYGRVVDDAVSTFNDGLGSDPTGADILAGSDGRMWLSFTDRSKVARVTVPPLVKSPAAGDVTADSIALSVPLRPNGLATTYAVEHRVPSGSWQRGAFTTAGAATTLQSLSASVTGLLPDTEYQLRVVASNVAGDVTGAITTVRTAVQQLPVPVPTVVPTAIPSAVPTVVGDVLTPGGGDPLAPVTELADGVTGALPGDDPAAEPTPAPVPVLGESVVVAPDRGTVKVKLPGGGYKTLEAGKTIPMDALIDTTDGRVALSSQLADGTTQIGRFSGGKFRVQQSDARGGLTRIFLAGRLDCGRSTGATVAKKKRKRRQIWGNDDGGNFQTNGRESVATVRGTRWLTRDTCKGTLVKVVRGAVDVREHGRGKSIRLEAGESHLTPRR